MRRRLLTKARHAAGPLLARIPLKTRRKAKERIDPTVAMGVARSALGRAKPAAGPLVTIVVPVYNVQDYLPRFLASVVSQSYRNLEILVVNDGSPDRSAQIAKSWAILDPRIRVVDRTNGGLGAARNTGVEEARGEYISFADSDDELALDAISVMLRSLQQTGSDFVVGTIVRLRGNSRWIPHWARSAHREYRRAIRLDDHPQMMLDVFACNKLWRTDFFRRVVGGFPTGIAYEDQEPSLKSYLGASSFDVISDQVYFWRVRDDGSSISQQKAKLTDLEDRIEVTKSAVEHILGHRSEVIRDEWFRKFLAYDFVQYAEQVPRTDSDYFDVLSRGLAQIIDMFGTDVPWQAVPIYSRLAGYFLARGEYDNLLSVLSGRVYRGVGYRLEGRGDDLLAVPGYAEEFDHDLPADMYVIRPENLELVTRVEGARWLDGRRVEVSISAFCRSAFQHEERKPDVSLALEDTDTGERRELRTERYEDLYLNEAAGSEWRDASDSAVRATIDVADLFSTPEAECTRWRILATVRVAGHTVTEIVKVRARDTAAAVLGFSSFVDGRRSVLTHDDLDGLVLKRAAPNVRAICERLDGRRMTLKAEALNGKRITRLLVANRRTWQSYAVKPKGHDHRGRPEFDFGLRRLPEQHRTADRHTWNVKAEFSDGTSGQIAASYSTHDFDEQSTEPAPLMMYANSHGYLRVLEHPYMFTCDRIELSDDGLSASMSGRLFAGASTDPPTVTLAGGGVTISPERFRWEGTGNVYSATFPLHREDWYGFAIGMSNGGYTLRWTIPPQNRRAAPRVQWAIVGDKDANDFPLRFHNTYNTIRATRTPYGRTLWLRFSQPAEPHALGLRHRRVAIDQALRHNNESGLKECVVFESYQGKQIADSVRAFYDIVRERNPEVQTYWSVNSSAVSVPSGSTRIIHGTPEWLDAMHRSRYLVNNSNFPGYARLQNEQRYLQTWHGTPMKKIAEDIPAENLSLGYRLLMRREAVHWEFLLAQNPFSVEVLPAAFRYEGCTLALGYPRNDVLRSQFTSTIREKVRRRLGISAEAPVVLYAPTFRDSRRAAGGYAFSTEIDFSRLLRGLPQNTVILVRGHANTVPPDLDGVTDQVIDVGRYGEISELFLATDVLVTDYSSLLFDFAVTRKPMVFFVPDIEEYESSTRGFYLDFREICPGPMAHTTGEVASLVQDAIASPKSYLDQRYTEFVKRFAPWDDGHATERLWSVLTDAGWFSVDAGKDSVTTG